MTQKGIWIWASIGLLCALILSSCLSVYYYAEYTKQKQLYSDALNELRKYDKYIFVNILIDYGNQTREWHNGTLTVRGADLLNATRIVSEVEYIRGAYGAFVTHINSMGGDPNTYWLWYSWNTTKSGWDSGPVACDAYILSDGDTVSWIYTKF